MKNWHLLVVEDDPDGQEVVGRILRYHRIPFSTTGNAEDALKLLGTQECSGVIVDLNLPGMDGWSLLGEIKKNPKVANLPCVAVTAYHSAELAVKAIEMGFVAYFPKPFDATALVRELERVMN
jgi:two-component system, sensor histidine kinase and response regulator